MVRKKSQSHETRPPSIAADDAALKRFSFRLSAAETGQLFGVPGADDLSVKFAPTSHVREVRIVRRSDKSNYARFSITLRGGKGLSSDQVIGRLKAIAPNGWTKAPHTYEVNNAKTLLRYDPRSNPMQSWSVQVMTHAPTARAAELAEAFWVAGRYLVYGESMPSAAQLRLINGRPLDDVAKVKLDWRIETASKDLVTAFPDAICREQMDMLTSKAQLRCNVHIDHPHIQRVAFSWPNAKGAALAEAMFVATPKDQADHLEKLRACLQGLLGAGEKVVVDHASGGTQHEWQLDPAGDKLIVDDAKIHLRGPQTQAVDTSPAWTQRFHDIVGTLQKCQE